MITLAFMNEWLATHRDHEIRFARRRHADSFVDVVGDPLPGAAAVPQKVILTLTCDRCHRGFVAGMEDDEGQDITG